MGHMLLRLLIILRIGLIWHHPGGIDLLGLAIAIRRRRRGNIVIIQLRLAMAGLILGAGDILRILTGIGRWKAHRPGVQTCLGSLTVSRASWRSDAFPRRGGDFGGHVMISVIPHGGESKDGKTRTSRSQFNSRPDQTIQRLRLIDIIARVL